MKPIQKSIAAFAAVTVMLFSLSVSAHTGLRASIPANKSVVTEIPEQLELTFSGDVRLVKLELKGVGHDMPTDFKPSSEAKTAYIVKTPGMHPGKFTVEWSAMGGDGHIVSNTYSFTVDPGAE